MLQNGKWIYEVTQWAVGNPASVTATVTMKTGKTVTSTPIGVSLHSANTTWQSIPDSGARVEGISPFPMRVYPEQSSQQEQLKNTIKLIVSINPAIPTNRSGTVHTKLFDPMNQCAGYNGRVGTQTGDNGQCNMTGVDQITMTFNGGESEKFLVGTIIPAQPGANFIVAIHPSSNAIGNIDVTATLDRDKMLVLKNGELPTGQNIIQTPLLSVWRTLHVERDCMKFNNPNLITAQSPILDSLVIGAFNDACIEVTQYGTTENFWGNEFDHDTENDLEKYRNARSSPVPTAEFWTAHVIGGFRQCETLNCDGTQCFGFMTSGQSYYQSPNTCVIFNSQIETLPPTALSFQTKQEFVTLHELGHLCYGEHEDGGVMTAGFGGQIPIFFSLLIVSKKCKIKDILVNIITIIKG